MAKGSGGRTMDTTPRAEEIWPELGGHFDSVSQVIAEFVDNSIGNFEANDPDQSSILIHLHEEDGRVRVTLEDTGTGISDFEAALRLGDKDLADSPRNEHGFGLKHALAAANPGNDDWKICTRTQEDYDQGVFRVVSDPYRFDLDEELEPQAPWPGNYNTSGTYIEFVCSRSFFDTIQEGIPGKAKFRRCLDYLREELGYVYAGVIDRGVSIRLMSEDYNKTVEVVRPDWEGFYDPKPDTTEIDLGGGTIELSYKFGEVTESDHVKYYQRNLSTSGVELRINGRLMMSNLFKEIWNKEPHPQYNHFLAIIDLRAEDIEKLPRTRTSKNGIRSGDEKLETLFDWIRKVHSSPKAKLTTSIRESQLIRELADMKETHIPDPKNIEREKEVYEADDLDNPPKMDLHVFDGSDSYIYEAKKGKGKIQDVYQLVMYWDGAVRDGIQPKQGILLAPDFSKGVEPVVELFNRRKDEHDEYYNLITKTWRDEGIDYPQ